MLRRKKLENKYFKTVATDDGNKEKESCIQANGRSFISVCCSCERESDGLKGLLSFPKWPCHVICSPIDLRIQRKGVRPEEKFRWGHDPWLGKD